MSEGLSFQTENKKEYQDVKYCFIANFHKEQRELSYVLHRRQQRHKRHFQTYL
jgi:hypothetical protein